MSGELLVLIWLYGWLMFWLGGRKEKAKARSIMGDIEGVREMLERFAAEVDEARKDPAAYAVAHPRSPGTEEADG